MIERVFIRSALFVLLLMCEQAIAENYQYDAKFNFSVPSYNPTSATSQNDDGWFNDGPMASLAIIMCGNNRKVSCSDRPWLEVETGIWIDSDTNFSISNSHRDTIKYNQRLSGGVSTVRGRCDNAYLRSDNKAWILPCTWYGTINNNIVLTPANGETLVNQSINLKIESGRETTMSGFSITGATHGTTLTAPSYQNDTISSGYFKYQTYTHTITSCCNLNIYDDGYITTQGFSIKGSGSLVFSYSPDSVSASFDSSKNTTVLSKIYEGEKSNFEIGQLWLLHNDKYCNPFQDKLCNYITQNSKTSIICDSDKISITLLESFNSFNSIIRKIMGTWGKENINTTCSITILIPYE